MVAEQEQVEHEEGKAKLGFHNRGYSDVEVGGRRERLDTAYGTRTASQGRCDDQPPEDDEAADGQKEIEAGGAQKKRN